MSDLHTIPETDQVDFVIITGMSGAGRTEAMHAFEDLGYFCIDNLPSALIGQTVELFRHEREAEGTRGLAIVCDARSGSYFGQLDDELDKLRTQGIDPHIVFLDADDEKLVARYKSSRRRHPMCKEGETIAQGIQAERSLLFRLRERASFVLNTTDMLPQKLRDAIRAEFGDGNERRGLSVTVYSFGFKHGAPVDADVVIDVRFLPNPYYDPELRGLTGLDAPVRDFVMFRQETDEFMTKWKALLDTIMPGYVSEGKQQLAIGVGCTGGQHRSVAIAEATGDYLKGAGYRVSVAHRDLALAEGRKVVAE